MKKAIMAGLMALVIVPASAHAEERSNVMALLAAPAKAGCTLTENANVSINFNSIEKDAEAAGNIFDAKVKEIEASAKELKLEKLEVQSMNYSLYPYNAGAAGAAMQWQLSGNLAFQVLPVARAKDLLALLVKKGYQPSLSVNSYRSGTCQ